jgi:hypothetical protein
MENQDGIKQRDTNSIRYPQSVDDKIEKLAKSFRRSKKELFCQMVDYFYRSKKDPADSGDEVLKKELSAGINRILSFIKQQEKDYLLPVSTGTDILKMAASRQINFLENIGKNLATESLKTKQLVEYSHNLARELKIIAAGQVEKEALKQRFSELMEYYIQQREEMGWVTSAIKKEELITHVRKMIKQL